MRDVKKILIVTLSNLGDVVLTLPVFQSLHHAYPKAELHVVASPGAKAVFEDDPRVARVLLYDKKKGWRHPWGLLNEVRRERYDVIVDLRRSLLGLLGGARSRNSYLADRPRRGHRVYFHLRALGDIAPVWNEESFLKPRSKKRVPGFDPEPGEKLVVAAVGSKSDIKKWPAAHFAALLDRLALEDGCRVVLVGERNDVPDAEKIKKLMVSRTTDLTGRTSFDELVSVIAAASLVVTNDSAPLHIADSLKVRTLALFGPTDPAKYGPRASGSVAAGWRLFCSPCEKAQCRYHHECLKELGVDEVLQKARLILSDRTRSGRPKILVVRLDRMGDVVLSLPALEALRRQFPDAGISVLLRPATSALLQGHPAVDEVLTYDYGKKGRHNFPLGYLRLWKELVRRRFDMVFVLHPGLRSSLLPFLAGIPYRIGYKDRWRHFLTTAIEDRRHLGLKHESEYALDVVRAFTGDVHAPAIPRLFVSETQSARLSRRLSAEGLLKPDEKFIVLHPGASCPSKRWPLERFLRLGKRLLKEYPHRLLLIGGREEKRMGHALKSALGARVTDLTGMLDLNELASLLSRCELLVSNDSGPVHVAAAVGARVVSIFGRSNAPGLGPSRWRPLGPHQTVLHKDVGCVVCLAHDCPIGFECLKAVSVEEVFEAARHQISTHHEREKVAVKI